MTVYRLDDLVAILAEDVFDQEPYMVVIFGNQDFFRPLGISSRREISRLPKYASARVRGIGVAVIERRWGIVFLRPSLIIEACFCKYAL